MATAIATTKTTAPDPALQRYLRLALDRIEPDVDQPRKTFDEGKLRELADSIALHDVIVPIIVRPHPKKGDGWYMLIAGERRLRAAKLAAKKDIPAVVDETAYTAGELLERQLLENTRDDLTPLEEADTYAKLLKLPGYSMDLLITKTGKSKAHLYGRLKLLALAPFAKKSLQDGKLTVAIAELIARVDPKMQEQCTKEVLGKLDDELEQLGIEPERIADDGKQYGGDPQPLSFDATRALIRRKYTTKLALAKFDPQDATLTKAGACTGCEHRSGNQPDLPGMANGKPEDLCTKPSCFEEKTHASWKKAAAAAAERGLEVVEGKDARHCFDWDGIKVRSGSPYVDLDTQLPYDLQKNPDKPKTFGELLGKHAAEIPRALVQDESGAPRELLDKRAAVAKLREIGKVDKPEKPDKPSSSSSGLSYEEQRARDEKKRTLNLAAAERTVVQIFEATPKKEKDLAIWRWIARRVLDDTYDMDRAAEHRGLKKVRDVIDLVDKMKSLDDLRKLLVDCLGCSVAMKATTVYAASDDKADFAELCKLLGVDHEKSIVLAKEAAKAEAKADAAKDAKKPAKKKGGK